MGAHRLVMSPRAIRSEETQRQITRIYRERGALKHDDRIDVLAATVEYYEDYLGVDVDHAIAAARASDMDEQWKMMKDDSKRGIWLLGDKVSGAVRMADPKFRNARSSGPVNAINRIKDRFK